jgi:hypothetical protein
MEVINFSNLESQVLDLINRGKKTYDLLLENVSFNEKSLTTVIEGLVSKNIIKLDTKSQEYVYQTKVNGDLVILDGNILLPTTILKLNDKIIVSRGSWYEFPIDFDVRRIIWNVKIDEKTNSTLVDLIKSSVLKVKKTKIIQIPEYENLRNKVVPYSDKIGLQLVTIGEEVTDIFILFKININQANDISVIHKGFCVQSEIDTNELIEELKLPVEQRNYSEKIKLNKIFNFSDFLFSKNEIPISLQNNILTYLKITGIKKSFEFTYYSIDSTGNSKKLDVEIFDDNTEAIEKLREIFRNLPSLILNSNNFTVEMTE